MGFTLAAYLVLAFSGGWSLIRRQQRQSQPAWLRSVHIGAGISLLGLVLLLLAIGLVGTLGHYGSLGHSSHFAAGFAVLELCLLSAWSAVQIHRRPWARSLHLGTNAVLLLALAWVSLTGWSVVQKYLP